MNLFDLTIHDAADGLRAKKFSSVELTESCIERTNSVEKKLNSYITQTDATALQEAKEADARFSAGNPRGPLDGIPCAIKDVYCTKGVRTTAASKNLDDFVPPYDATTVKKLKAAGMVSLGKTNTDEYTCGGSTESSYYGVTRNPWDLERVAGGSSGGSASAVAAGQCIYSLGTDTGGSIRQPASYCGITGLKPTYGRISRFGVISMASSLDTIGPMTKDVMDAALVLQQLAGHDVYDSTTPDVPVPNYLDSLKPNLDGIKVGVPKEFFIEGMDSDQERGVRDAIVELEKLGAKIVEVSLPHSVYGLAVYYIICPSEVSANMERYDGIRYGYSTKSETKDLLEFYTKTRAEGFGSEMKRRIMIGTYALSAGYYEAYYLKAQKVRTIRKREFEDALKEVDVLIGPTVPAPAFKVGEKIDDPLQLYLEDILTVSINISGVPSLAVPVGFSKNNLPLGMQIIGPQFGEEKILRVGYAFQQATDWHSRRAVI